MSNLPLHTEVLSGHGEARAVAIAETPTRARHLVLGITFLVAFVMYLDRAVIGTATPAIMREFGINKIAMGWTTSAFNWSYALLQLPGGWLADYFGSRVVLAAAIVWWSVFTAATGLVSGVRSLAIARALFGAGEAAAFPAASRALVPWLPANRRAFGQGFQHAGARFGAAVAPVLVGTTIVYMGWRPVFYVLCVAGCLLAVVWFWYYRNSPGEHRGVNAAELAIVGRARVAVRPAVPWRAILSSRDLWLLTVMYFCYGWVLWVYLQWLPTYLSEERQFSQLKVGLTASLPLLAATIANPIGGSVSDWLASAWGLRRGRVSVLIAGFLVAAIALLPAVLSRNSSTALACLVVALAGLELTVAVSWAMCIDLGRQFSGSVSGVMNTGGNLGGACGAVVVGYMATLYGWTSVFVLASTLCLAAAVLALFLNPAALVHEPGD